MAAPSRRRSNKLVRMSTADPASTPARRSARVTDGDIARRAFELYCERGREDGHDIDDWLQAERELRGDAAFTAA